MNSPSPASGRKPEQQAGTKPGNGREQDDLNKRDEEKNHVPVIGAEVTKHCAGANEVDIRNRRLP